jgi:hypothetical protein
MAATNDRPANGHRSKENVMSQEPNLGGITFQPDTPDVGFRADSGMGGTSGLAGSSSLGETDEPRGAVKTAAMRLGEQARDRVTSRLHEQKSRAADTLGGVAQALLVAGQHLQEQNQGSMTPYVERLAHQVERVSHFLEDTNVDEVASDVGQFARRHPGLFIGGALVLGFVGARFLRSSQRNPQMAYDTSYSGTDLTGEYGVSRGYDATTTPGTSGLAHTNETPRRDSTSTGPDTGVADRAGSYGAAGGVSGTTGLGDDRSGAMGTNTNL